MEPDALNIEAKTPRGQDLVGSLKRLPDGTILYAALTLARDLVIDEFVQVVRDLIGDANAIIQPVKAQEAERNMTTAVTAALTGKRDSAKMSVSPELLGQVRERFSDVDSPSGPQPATASTRSLIPKPDTLQPIARLSPSEAESLRSEMQRSLAWAQQELKRG